MIYSHLVSHGNHSILIINMTLVYQVTHTKKITSEPLHLQVSGRHFCVCMRSHMSVFLPSQILKGIPVQ